MSRTVPWSIKDISFDARQLARDAAERAGMSVGDWLDALIAERTRNDSVALSEIEPVAEEQQQLAATGTDGPLRRFAGDERQVTQGIVDRAMRPRGTAVESSRSAERAEPGRFEGTAQGRDPAIRVSESGSADTARHDEPPVDPGPPAKADPALKEQTIRAAVAAIMRRQADLDADLPPRETGGGQRRMAATEDAKPATLGDIGKAVSALEARLASGHAGSRNPQGDAMADQERGSAASDRSGAAFEALARDLRRAMKDIDARPRRDASGFGARDLARADDSVGADPRGGMSAFADTLRGGGDLMATTAGAPTIGGLPRRQSVDLRPRTQGPARALEPDRLEADQMWSEIRALLERFRPGSAIESLDRRMQDLTAQIERRMEEPSSALIQDLARRIDVLQSSLQMPQDTATFEALLRGIGDRIDKVREASADMQHLEAMMRTLADKIDDRRSLPDTRAMSALEAQIDRLGERLDRSETNLTSLDAVEQTLRELFSQLEQTRHAAIDAAETAARTAAHDTLRAALQGSPNARPGDIRTELAEKVAQEVHDLKLQHDASERRTQATMAGLHQALETLIERLANPDAAGRRGAPATSRLSAPNPAAALSERSSGTRDAAAAPPLPPEAREQPPLRDADPADMLIEPGAGRNAVKSKDAKSAPQTSAERRLRSLGVAAPVTAGEGPSSFIAAARRAAQAAQASAAAAAQAPGQDEPGESGSRTASAALALLDRIRAYLAQRRRPILLGLAGLVLLLGALEVVKIETEAPPPQSAQVESSGIVAPSPLPHPSAQADATSPQSAVASVVGPGLDQAGPASRPPRPDAEAQAGGTPSAKPASPGAAPAAGDVAAGAAKSGEAPKIGNPFLSGLVAPADGLSAGLRASALAGDPAAQYEVGLRYAEGRTVNRDPKMATGWFEKAASQGMALAQYRLGSAFEKGIGESRDPALAMAWYGRAADAGNMRAMHNLAVMAAEGAVAKPDYVKAATWFGKAAALGVRDSQFNLAILYARGLGIEQNLVQSYTWFAIAAAQGDDDAAKKRDEVGARLDAKSLASAKAAADNFKPALSIRSANEAPPPPGGWDAVAPPARPGVSSQGSEAPKISVM